jgi:hypothetical protein
MRRLSMRTENLPENPLSGGQHWNWRSRALSITPSPYERSSGRSTTARLPWVIRQITFSDYLFLDVASGSNLTLATTGNIYVWAPAAGLYGISMDFRTPVMFPNVPLWADDYFYFNVVPVTPPTHFQDVVLRVTGPVGRIRLEAQGGIVVDSIAVPVPEPSMWWSAPAGLLVAWGRNWSRRRARVAA